MKHASYIIIVALLVWVYLLSNKPSPEPVEIIREIQVGQERLDSALRVAEYWKEKRYADSIRWTNTLNERMKAVNYYKREMNKRRDIPVPEADSLTELMLKNISVGGGR